MRKMIAQREIHYAQKTYHAGDELEMEDNDAHLLGLLEHVKAPDDQKASSQSYRTAAVQPESQPTPPPAPMTTEANPALTPPASPKKYKRRDMRAEE